MTPTLRFATEEALRVAVTSALLSDDLVRAPAWGWRTLDGAVWIRPLEPVGAHDLAVLEELGLSAVAEHVPEDARRARCWAEVIPLRRDVTREGPEGQVLFLAPDGRALLETASELVRLGCDRVELRALSAGQFLLRTIAPPYYTFARALDRASGLRAFVPSAPGQERVYVEAGYAHPLGALLRPEPAQMLLVSNGSPWLSLAGGEWTDLDAIVDLSVPVERRALEARSELPRLAVPVRLVRAARAEAASLWVIREDAIARTERLLASIPEDVAWGLLFAVTTADPPTVVVRTRASARHGAALDLEDLTGEMFRPHAQVPNLYLPIGFSLEPPLRRERVRDVFAPDASDVAWVIEAGRELRVERLPEEAFRPLPEWVEYVVDRGADALSAWVQGASFDLRAFEVEFPRVPRTRDDLPKVGQPAATPPPAKRAPKSSPARPEAKPAPPVESPRGRSRARARKAPDPPAIDQPRARPAAGSSQLAAREREFLALEAPADAPERTALWATMAALHARAGHARDGALCWTRALWDAEPVPASRIAVAWWSAEARSVRDIKRLLESTSPTRDDVGAIAALLTGGVLGALPRLGLDYARVSVWLDRHDEVLDVRSLWLARASLARLAGGDRLGLARARDRVLQRLHRGLSIERDLPTFLRFLGGAREPDRIERLGGCLVRLAQRYEKTRRASSAVEADPKLTLAYVLFVVGYGCARVGRSDEARALATRASTLLALEDPVHAFLAQAYSARVEQAVEGLAVETPLPPDLAGSLNALDKFARYKVDRVRQFSTILEPHERLDPASAFQRGGDDPRGAEFTRLRGMANVAELEEALEAILRSAHEAAPEERARLFDGAMDFFPQIGADRASRHLEEIATSLTGVGPRRAELLEEALMLAGHVGDQELARRIFELLRALVAGLGAEDAAAVAPAMGRTLRTLRRFGMRGEASQLLGALQAAATGTTPAAKLSRLHGAAALAYLGEFEQARAVFDEIERSLSDDLPMSVRLELTRALARAVGEGPLEYALGVLDKLAERLPVVTDSFNTNSHVCVSVVAFVEAIVLGYASDDLTLGPRGRQLLDEDEYLIRRRVHRDMAHE